MIKRKTACYLLLALLCCQNVFSARRSYGRSQAQQHQRQYRPAAQEYQQNQYGQACQQQLQVEQQYGAYTGDAQAVTYSDSAGQQGYMGEQESQAQTHASSGGSLQDITSDSELQAVLSNPQHTIIYITAGWCEACTRHMEPVLNAAASKYGDRISFRRLDFDRFNKQIQKMGVDTQGVPRTVFRQNGRQIVIEGSRPEQYFMGQVEQFLGGNMKPEVVSTGSARPAKSKK